MKSLSKQNVGKSRTKNKVSNGLWSIWERKLYVLSGNSTSEVTEKRSAHIPAPWPVWLNRSSCVSIYSGAIHIPIYLLRGRWGNTSFRQNWYLFIWFREFELDYCYLVTYRFSRKIRGREIAGVWKLARLVTADWNTGEFQDGAKCRREMWTHYYTKMVCSSF